MLDHREPVAAQRRPAHTQLCPQATQTGERLTAAVVLVLLAFRLPEQLAVGWITWIDAAAVEQELDAVIVIAAGEHLIGALELLGSSRALLRRQARQAGGDAVGHAQGVQESERGVSYPF